MYDYQMAKQNISNPNGTKCQHFQKNNYANLAVTHVYGVPVSNKVYNMKNSVISAPSSCQNGVDPIQLIILVFTHPVNYRNRMVARLTWKRSRPFSDQQIVVKFVMGHSEDKNINEVTDKESILYNDVIKVDLIDKPENETLKHLLAFKWTAQFCSSNFVMKILDNVFISSGNLVGYLSSLTTKSQFVACPKVNNGSKPIREKGNTWYVSEEEWQSENYPPYCANAMFIMSMDVTKSVVEHLSERKLFRFTDVQLGDIHEKIGITPIEDEKLSHHQLRPNEIDTLLDDLCTSSSSQSVFTNFNDIVREGILKEFLADSRPNCTKKISESAKYRNHVSFSRTVGTRGGSTKFQYILNTPDRCLRHKKSLHLFIMIMTKPENENFRTQIRSTWASQRALQSTGVDYAFVVGNSSNALQSYIVDEAMKYLDIISGDFEDTFHNQTLKTVFALQWASKFCNNTNYLLKTGDDMFINVAKIMSFLGNGLMEANGLVLGNVLRNTVPIRNPTNIYYTSIEIYPNNTYPEYPSGAAYMMSSDVVRKVYDASSNIPLFPWEDVYIGLVLRNLSIQTRQQSNFLLQPVTKIPDVCYMRNLFNWNVLTPIDMKNSFIQLQNSGNVSCFENDTVINNPLLVQT
ncbi:beta-1,3-galactosyltransferase 9-like [Glandiceps talaboti]